MATRKEIRSVFGEESNVTDAEIKALLDLIHNEVDAVRDERDVLKTKVEELTKSIETVTSERDKASKDFEDYKTAQATEQTKAQKKTAYRDVLAKAGISEKWLDKIVRLTDLDTITINADGTVRGVDKLTESIRTEYADYIGAEGIKGADVQSPPSNDSSKSAFDAMSLSEKMAFANTHPAEYAEYTK